MKLEGSEAFERNFQIDETGKIQVRGLEKEVERETEPERNVSDSV